MILQHEFGGGGGKIISWSDDGANQMNLTEKQEHDWYTSFHVGFKTLRIHLALLHLEAILAENDNFYFNASIFFIFLFFNRLLTLFFQTDSKLEA